MIFFCPASLTEHFFDKLKLHCDISLDLANGTVPKARASLSLAAGFVNLLRLESSWTKRTT